MSALKDSFYLPSSDDLDAQWNRWLQRWSRRLSEAADLQAISAAMRRVSPAITWREWLIAPAYQQAADGEFSLIRDLQTLFSSPCEAPPAALAVRYHRPRPREFFNAGGVSHYSCSS